MQRKALIVFVVISVIVIIIVPVLLNFILLIPSPTKIIGDANVWLSFFASFIGAVASFGMIFFTYQSLMQNQQQLEELKRQWDESQRARLQFKVIKYRDGYYLEVHNCGKEDAYNVNVHINDDFLDALKNNGNREYIECISDASFYVSAGKSVFYYFGLSAPLDHDDIVKSKHLILNGSYNDRYSLDIDLPLSHFLGKKQMRNLSPTELSLEFLAKGISGTTSMTGKKTVVEALSSISKSLETITQAIKADENGRDK